MKKVKDFIIKYRWDSLIPIFVLLFFYRWAWLPFIIVFILCSIYDLNFKKETPEELEEYKKMIAKMADEKSTDVFPQA